MNLKLIKGSKEYEKQIIDMLIEWSEYNKTHITNTSPASIFKNDYNSFDYYLENLEISTAKDGLVPDSTFFLS